MSMGDPKPYYSLILRSDRSERIWNMFYMTTTAEYYYKAMYRYLWFYPLAQIVSSKYFFTLRFSVNNSFGDNFPQNNENETDSNSTVYRLPFYPRFSWVSRMWLKRKIRSSIMHIIISLFINTPSWQTCYKLCNKYTNVFPKHFVFVCHKKCSPL